MYWIRLDPSRRFGLCSLRRMRCDDNGMIISLLLFVALLADSTGELSQTADVSVCNSVSQRDEPHIATVEAFTGREDQRNRHPFEEPVRGSFILGFGHWPPVRVWVLEVY